MLLTTDLAPGTSGTKYFLSQQGIVTVTPDGLMTAQSLGSVKVTIINGSAEVVVPVLVQAPQTGNVSVGDAGAVVQGSDGSYVAVPPGDVGHSPAHPPMTDSLCRSAYKIQIFQAVYPQTEICAPDIPTRPH